MRVESERELQEEFLCSLNFPGKTTTVALKFLKHSIVISWNTELNEKKCIGMCTDGAASMTGHRAGVVAKVKMVVTQTLCLGIALYIVSILWQKNVSRTTQGIILSDAIKIMNEIRHKALNSQIFETL